MIETVVKGFIIGLLVSSPMGPVNMLCVQRTLNKGRKHGFATGMGAMLSDLTYATITMFGLSFVEEFLQKHDTVFQFVGSVLLFVFGFFVFRTNPLKEWTPQTKTENSSCLRDFVSSFFITFSNVAIILVFITLYARFTFMPVNEGVAHWVAALIAIALGAFSWWFFISWFIARLRKHFNRQGLVILNRIVGSILMIISVAGVLFSVFGITL